MFKISHNCLIILCTVVIAVILIIVSFYILHEKQNKDTTYLKLQKINRWPKVGNLYVPFISNEGQVDKNIRYYARFPGATASIVSSGQIVYSLSKNKDSQIECKITEEIVNNSIANIRGVNPATTKINYFKGKSSSRWHGNIPTYDEIILNKVYDGIDLILKASGNTMEKLFYVQPGSKPERIRMKLADIETLAINAEDELEVQTRIGLLTFSKPVAYQEIMGCREYVEIAYVLNGNEYGFDLGEYDKNRELIIDPLLSSTYFGGGDYEFCSSLAVDQDGDIYIAGHTRSGDLPSTTDGFSDTFNGDKDVFIARLDKTLSILKTCTYIGGSGLDECRLMKRHQDGNIYLTGNTESDNFPTTHGVRNPQYNKSGKIIFVSILDSSLSTLQISTYLGVGPLEVYDMYIDSHKDVYLTGTVYDRKSAPHLRTDGTYIPGYAAIYDRAAFISKLSNSLSHFKASTIFYGKGRLIFGAEDPALTYGTTIAVDKKGNIYLAGRTYKAIPTTSDVYQRFTRGRWFSLYIAKFDSSLKTLLASTYLDGTRSDFKAITEPRQMIVNQAGYINITGFTNAPDFPTTAGAFMENIGGKKDIFISQLDSNLKTLISSTFLGGSGHDIPFSIQLEKKNDLLYLAGATASSDFPISPNAYDKVFGGGSEAFVAKLDDDLKTLFTSTFLGGDDSETYSTIRLLEKGQILVGGYTRSADFPVTANAHNKMLTGINNAFVAKFDTSLSDANAEPQFVSSNTVTVYSDSLFEYIAEAYDPEGFSISIHFEDYPSWLTPDNTTISGIPLYTMKDTSFVVVASDGELMNRMLVSVKFDSEPPSTTVPESYTLHQNFPNPFNQSTTVRFNIEKPEYVTLRVYNIRGQEVATLLKIEMPIGEFEICWEPRRLSEGVYLYRMNAGKFSETKKMIFTR